MKKIISAIALLVTVFMFACNSNNISIETEDSLNDLNFSANYPEYKTESVQTYIENALKEKRIFKSATDKKKAEIRLSDGTNFYINYEPGFISISFEKDHNSYSAYVKVKKMCANFGRALKL